MKGLHEAMLRAAGLLVPAAQRAEWFAEWSAELCYVTRGRTRFCLGAFRDAYWLRRNGGGPVGLGTWGLQSPVSCLLVLAIVAAICVTFAVRLPEARNVMLPSPYRDAGYLAMIWSGPHEAKMPTISPARYRKLVEHPAARLSGVAFYRPRAMRLEAAPGDDFELAIAEASANLFELLGIPVTAAGRESLVLSEAAWRKYFHGDAQMVGRKVLVGGRAVAVAAVLPANAWRLPGRVDGWLLEDAQRMGELPSQAAGFVVGRLRNSASLPAPEQRWSVFVSNGAPGLDRFECSAVDQSPTLPACFLMMLLAVLIASTSTPLSLGEYPKSRNALPGAMRLRRWIFFAAKIGMLAPIVFCGTLDLASPISLGTQPIGFLLACDTGAALGIDRSAPALPGLPALADEPYEDRRSIADLIGMVWHGVDLRPRTRAAVRPGNFIELLQRAAVGVSGCIVEQPVFVGNGTLPYVGVQRVLPMTDETPRSGVGRILLEIRRSRLAAVRDSGFVIFIRAARQRSAGGSDDGA